MTDCDIVILTKDRPDYLARLKNQLLLQGGITANIVVVDNGTDTETETIVRDQSDDPQFTWHYYKTEIEGFAHGVNLGAKYLNEMSPALVLLNNDVQLVQSNTLLSLLAHLQVKNQTGIAGVRLLNSNGTINHDGTSFSSGYPFHMGRGIDPSEVDAVCALTPATTFACVAINRWMFNDLGGMNEDYKWGSEDVDFCLTAAERGYRTMTCRKSYAIHDEFGTRKEGSDKKEGLYFYGKWAVTGRGMEALRVLEWPLMDACQVNA